MRAPGLISSNVAIPILSSGDVQTMQQGALYFNRDRGRGGRVVVIAARDPPAFDRAHKAAAYHVMSMLPA